MRTGALVAALTGAGIAGGVVGGLLSQGGARPPAPGAPDRAAPAPAVADEAVARELASLRARLDEMQASVAAASAESARLQSEVEKERAEAAEARRRIESLETARADAPSLASAARGVRFGDAGSELIRLEGALGDRLRKAGELRALPEDERWTKAREALGLTGGQEEELKAAIKERAEAMRAAIVVDNRDGVAAGGGGGDAMTVRMPDLEKIREARRKYDDRVNAALTPEQSKKWREEGYESALGNRGSIVASTMVVEADR